VVNIDQKNRGLPHNKIVFWLESSYGCTSPILGKIGGASRINAFQRRNGFDEVMVIFIV
jgi:hypothetical protein